MQDQLAFLVYKTLYYRGLCPGLPDFFLIAEQGIRPTIADRADHTLVAQFDNPDAIGGIAGRPLDSQEKQLHGKSFDSFLTKSEKQS